MGPPPDYTNSERGEVESEVYGIWVDMGRGIVVSFPHSRRSGMKADRGLGFALLDVRPAS